MALRLRLAAPYAVPLARAVGAAAVVSLAAAVKEAYTHRDDIGEAASAINNNVLSPLVKNASDTVQKLNKTLLGQIFKAEGADPAETSSADDEVLDDPEETRRALDGLAEEIGEEPFDSVPDGTDPHTRVYSHSDD